MRATVQTRRLLSALSGVDPRTIASYLAGRPVREASAMRIREALAAVLGPGADDDVPEGSKNP